MRPRLLASIFILAFVGLFVPQAALADDADEPLSPLALEISNNLNCPVCEGQSVRDSNSQLARDMRRTVQEKLNEGQSEQEVYDYFVDRYGVGILRNPPKSGFFMTLWWAPVIAVAIGALILGTFVTQRRRSTGKVAPDQSIVAQSEESRVDGDDDLSEWEAKVLRQLDDRNQGREDS